MARQASTLPTELNIQTDSCILDKAHAEPRRKVSHALDKEEERHSKVLTQSGALEFSSLSVSTWKTNEHGPEAEHW